MDDHARVLAAFERLHAAGCPLPTADQRERIAKVAFRRWRTFDRRSRIRRPSPADRIRDLARGLVNALEADPRLVGPLIRDYECLAEAFAAAIDPTADRGQLPPG
ncbi:hypothetical protein [Polymorphospora rubra]|uniref:Uncharacterized protein n=1 Tax=Polymorphospora rubra TaxID=338584 RepID=A0A810N8C5_9ACTN|nr:hypothetical protein [Polymorphospora rubra]BCJ69270.1 hypothetical protein Prubr_62910 [Polymorphospora rubra]